MSTRVEIITGSLKGSIIENAASEATLQELLDVLKRMSSMPGGGTTGGGSSGSNNNNGGNKQQDNPPQPSAFSKMFDAFGRALSNTSSILQSGNSNLSAYARGLGNAAALLPGHAKALSNLIDVFATAIEIAERWNATLKELSNVGASFNNSIFDMRIAAAGTLMPLEQFAELVKTNSDAFAALGGTVTKGAQAFSRLSSQMFQPGGIGQNLLNMGMTVDQVNSGLAKYLGTTMRGVKAEDMNVQRMTALYSNYAETIDRIAKLQGAEKEELEKKVQAIQNEAAWQLKLQGADEETRAKMTAALTQAAEIYGPKGAEALKEYMLTGGTLITKESQHMASLFPEMTKGFGMSMNAANDKRVRNEVEMAAMLKQRREVEIVEGDKALKNASGAIMAGGAGMGGTVKILADVAGHMAKNVSSYGAKSGELTAMQIREREAAAKAEQNKNETITTVLNNFSLGVKTVYNRFVTGFVDMADRFIRSLNINGEKITEFFTSIIDNIDPIMDMLEDALYGLSDFIVDYVMPPLRGLGSIIELAVDGWKMINDVLSDSTDGMSFFGDIIRKTVDVVKMVLDVFSILTRDTDSIRTVFKVFSLDMQSLYSSMKIFVYKLLDLIPGTNYSKEIKAAEEEKLNIDREAAEKRAKFQENLMALERERESRKAERDKRDETTAKERNDRANKRAKDREESERTQKERKKNKEEREALEKKQEVPATVVTPAMQGLGKVAAHFESGGKAGTVSTGHGDFGGKSYGAFQLSSKTGDVDKFLKSSGYSDQFKGMQVGSAEFDKKWKELGATKEFAEAQRQHAIKQHYNPQMERLQKQGIDLSGKGAGVQEAVMSTANQYGANTDMIVKSLKGKDVSKMSDKDIINAIQDYKADTIQSRFKSSSEAVRAGVAKRVEQERSMLLSQDGKPIDAQTTRASSTAALPTGKDLRNRMAEEREQNAAQQRDQKEATQQKKKKAESVEPAEQSKSETSLSEVVQQLIQLNIKVAELTNQQRDLINDQIKAVRSNSNNIYARQ